MRRIVTTTVQLKLHSLTQRKARLIEREYTAFQDAVHPVVPDQQNRGTTPRGNY